MDEYFIKHLSLGVLFKKKTEGNSCSKNVNLSQTCGIMLLCDNGVWICAMGLL